MSPLAGHGSKVRGNRSYAWDMGMRDYDEEVSQKEKEEEWEQMTKYRI